MKLVSMAEASACESLYWMQALDLVLAPGTRPQVLEQGDHKDHSDHSGHLCRLHCLCSILGPSQISSSSSSNWDLKMVRRTARTSPPGTHSLSLYWLPFSPQVSLHSFHGVQEDHSGQSFLMQVSISESS